MVSNNNNDCPDITAILSPNVLLNPIPRCNGTSLQIALCKDQQVKITLLNGTTVRVGNNKYTITNRCPLDHEYDNIPTINSYSIALLKGTCIDLDNSSLNLSVSLHKDLYNVLPLQVEAEIPAGSILVDRELKTYSVTSKPIKIWLDNNIMSNDSNVIASGASNTSISDSRSCAPIIGTNQRLYTPTPISIIGTNQSLSCLSIRPDVKCSNCGCLYDMNKHINDRKLRHCRNCGNDIYI